jgi:hypothetical protein
MSVQQLNKELSAIAESPNRFEPEVIKRALSLFSQIFVAEHSDT